MDNYKIINMADVESKEVDFLWYPYIPFGKLTIVQGDPGEGKTTAVLQIAALLTRGEKLPEDEQEREPIHVIYQTAEDGLADTIKPRLEAAGADCSKVHVIDESEKGLSMLDERIEMALKETGAKMLILDPIQAYLGSKVDMHRANEIRPVMKHIGDIADKYGCAVILIGHMNKASGCKSTYRGLGSIDFQATARSVLIVGRVKDDPTCRVIAHDKSSLAPEGSSIAFRLDKENGFCWEGAVDISVEDLLSGEQGAAKLAEAKAFLSRYLADGAKPTNEVKAAAAADGIKERTLETAKGQIHITSIKMGNVWYWGF
ncbi:MAG: AAA family ATPase [Lachnospiraceae bacterium]|nr:AAA family ATPase [Lachnospiraceae bacterium]